MFEDKLLEEVRDRFCHVDSCPFQGPRAFFENAGGSLTLKSVVEVNTSLAGIPDNQGRDNPASHELVKIIEKSRQDAMLFLGASDGQIIVGESGTELLFRLVRAATFASAEGGVMLGSTLEHPATRSASRQWAEKTNKTHVLIEHDNATASITSDDYKKHVTVDTRVATIIQTSPVTGMGVDIAAVSREIRAVAPDCFIIVDGPRMAALPHEKLDGSAELQWELGTRDTSAYATFSEVVRYIEWLGSHFTNSTDVREQILAAGKAMADHEESLVSAMIDGINGKRGLRDIPQVTVIGGLENPKREGLVAITVEGFESADVVTHLNNDGVRTHTRKNDYFSGNILDPLGLESCIRVSMCHYNSPREVEQFLTSLERLVDPHGG